VLRLISRRVLALASLVCALAAPAVASASRWRAGTSTAGTTTTTGGAGLGGTGTPGATTTGTTTTPAPATATVPGLVRFALGQVIWSSGDGITISVSGSTLRGQPVDFVGTAPASDTGATALIRYATPTAPAAWVQVAQAPVTATGAFSAAWKPSVAGLLDFTVTVVTASAVPAADPPTANFTVQVFSSSTATIYGPGLWGHRTACGEQLHRTTLGVASRTAKCGTEVAVYYRGSEIVVPVIDRGPYRSRAHWDLTEATAVALGVRQTATVRTIEPWPESQQLSAPS
jgi:rare lipoprotein A